MNSNAENPFFDQFIDDYFSECEEHLTFVRSRMLSIELGDRAGLVNANVLDELLRSFHSLKGLSAMVGIEEATQLAHSLEDYLRNLKEAKIVPSEDAVERVFAGIDAIERVIEARRKSEPTPDVSRALIMLDAAVEQVPLGQEAAPEASPPRTWRFEFRPSTALAEKGITVNTVRDQLLKIGQIVSATPLVPAEGGIAFEFMVATNGSEETFVSLQSSGIRYSAPAAEARPEKGSPQPSVTGPLNVIRVEMSRLDDLMQMVGELVIDRFRLDDAVRLNDTGALQQINLSMERQLRELREAVM